LLLLLQVGAVEEVAAEALQEMVERRLHRYKVTVGITLITSFLLYCEIYCIKYTMYMTTGSCGSTENRGSNAIAQVEFRPSGD
jgi:hypothetical protein